MIPQQPIISFKHTGVLYGTDGGPPSTEPLNAYHVQVSDSLWVSEVASTTFLYYSEHGFTEEVQGRYLSETQRFHPIYYSQ